MSPKYTVPRCVSAENRRDVDDAGCVEPLHDRWIGQQAPHGGGRAGRSGHHDAAVVVHRLIDNHLTGPQSSESIVTGAKGQPAGDLCSAR